MIIPTTIIRIKIHTKNLGILIILFVHIQITSIYTIILSEISSYNQPSAHRYKESQYERNQYDAPPVRAAAPAQARAPASRIPTQSRVPAGYANVSVK